MNRKTKELAKHPHPTNSLRVFTITSYLCASPGKIPCHLNKCLRHSLLEEKINNKKANIPVKAVNFFKEERTNKFAKQHTGSTLNLIRTMAGHLCLQDSVSQELMHPFMNDIARMIIDEAVKLLQVENTKSNIIAIFKTHRDVAKLSKDNSSAILEGHIRSLNLSNISTICMEILPALSP